MSASVEVLDLFQGKRFRTTPVYVHDSVVPRIGRGHDD